MSKRIFTDAWLRPISADEAVRMVKLVGELGFSAIAIEGNDEIFRAASEAASQLGLELFRRKTINVNLREMLYEELSRHRWYYDLISVRSDQREVLMAALRDNRVDTVLLSHSSAPFIDHHMVSVANNLVEVALSDILEYGYESFYRVMKLAPYLRKNRIRVIMTSGASEISGIRTPRQLASVMLAIGVHPDMALDTVSGKIIELLRENREKLKGLLEPTGVWRIEG
ncbi:MAG: RNase P subunit p30 family protein [Nitrososphaerota archaeon]